MAPQVIRWGIISTGGIATRFCEDILVDPSLRSASDVAHKIVAIGSRSTSSAQNFIDKFQSIEGDSAWGIKNGMFEGCKAYGSYEEVYNDPNVDALYIGTPHTFHHANTKAGLLAGKHVLCEKPFTLDLEELDELIALAKEKNLFLMEAVWTRFQPLAYAVQKLLFSGKLGKIKRFSADFSVNVSPDTIDLKHRMVNPELGGGGLLDLGPYPSVWAMLTCYQDPANKSAEPKLLNSYQTLHAKTKVDENCRWLLEFGSGVQAELRTDLRTVGAKEYCVYISCEEADLAIEWPPYCPHTFHVIPHPGDQGSITEKETHHYPVTGAGGGMAYEGDEVARCVRDGKIESERMSWKESRIVQGIFDQVRRNGTSVLANVKGNAGK